jgi:molybdenum cofactor synthesis domain-containing protein
VKAVRDPEEEAPLVPIDEWRKRILADIERLHRQSLALDQAWGCVLAADVRAPADLPGYTSSAMDGFAVRAKDVAAATQERPVELRVAGEIRMGRATDVEVREGDAVAIPTGGVVPTGADAVVPVELCAVSDDRVLVLRSVPSGKHVRPAGEDARAGDVLVRAGRRLLAPDLGALAAAGLDAVDVYPRARVGVVSTGDELVGPGEPLHDGQIYDANGPILSAAVRDAAAIPAAVAVVGDEPGSLVKTLERIADDVDVFVCSGGVSAGERDPVKRAFERGDVRFANVAMQPGRPQAFGSFEGKPFFGLPGNPVSVFVSFVVFVYPALMKMMGREPEHPQVTAVLEKPIEAPRTRTRYARVRLSRQGEDLIAIPEGGHQSNLLATFARADGLAIIPAGRTIAAGETCRVIPVR